MIEEPYRWVEAIANRREYIETQLATGSPIAAVGYRDGILFLTVGKVRPKIFEIYDRIALGAIGHPGDIERLRLAAIELASTEGFTRSAADVSLRRLAFYSLSPAMKAAFEQIYGAPYLARLLFAEVGETPAEDLFLRVDYDGFIATNGGSPMKTRHDFGVLSGTKASSELMETFLAEKHENEMTQRRAFRLALDAWSIGRMALGGDLAAERPSAAEISAFQKDELKAASIEAAVLERAAISAIRYRLLTDDEVKAAAGEGA